MLEKILKPYLDLLKGQKTYLAGLGLLGLAVYQFLGLGDFAAGVQSLLAALTALGLRHAIAEIPQQQQPASPPVVAVPPTDTQTGS